MSSAALVPGGQSQGSATQEHIRGSSMLLLGRVMAYGLEFAAQVLVVRYLSKADFGAFAYALSIVVALKSIAVLELPNTLARFIPVYREQRAYGRLVGSVALATGVIGGLGGVMALALYVVLGHLGMMPIDDPQTLALLVILGLMIPLEGLDALLTTILATMAGAAQIAVRQVISPAFKIVVVLAMMWSGSGVAFLALGYVATSIFNVLIYAWFLRAVLARQSWLKDWSPRQLAIPFREIFGFSLPLLTSTVVWMLMESSDAVLLGYFQGSESVANFRAVLPIPKVLATLTLVFAVLYTPIAARLYVRGQHDDVAALYSRVALWMTVVTFPIFALGFGFSKAVTIGLYGPRYDDSSLVLAILSVGYYFFALTGFNGLTLKIYKKLRYAVGVDIAAALLNVVVNLLLIPQWGAVGAAVGTAGTMIVHNALKQYGLWRYLGINLFTAPHVRVYGALFLVSLVLLVLGTVLPPSLWVAIPIATLASLLILWIVRHDLEIEATFPEVLSWPLATSLLRFLLK